MAHSQIGNPNGRQERYVAIVAIAMYISVILFILMHIYVATITVLGLVGLVREIDRNLL